jgi:hypothetical protein
MHYKLLLHLGLCNNTVSIADCIASVDRMSGEKLIGKDLQESGV